jgi:hypothetical protein
MVMVDDKTKLFLKRITAMKIAHTRAKNPEFKKLWADMTEQLILIERRRINHDAI